MYSSAGWAASKTFMTTIVVPRPMTYPLYALQTQWHLCQMCQYAVSHLQGRGGQARIEGAGQSRAGQCGAGQCGAGQGGAGQDGAGQRQGRVGQGRMGQGRNGAGQDGASYGGSRHLLKYLALWRTS